MRFLIPFALMLGACQATEPVATAPAPVVEVDPIGMLSEEERGALLSKGAQVLFWPQPLRAERFRVMETQFPGRTAAPVSPRELPAGTPIPGADQIAEAMIDNDLVGLMVLQDGEVRFEGYGEGLTATDRWVSFSVAKSLTAVLAGAALKDGAIPSLEAPVTDFIPELSGSAYDGVTVEQLMTMRSGVAWDENYASPTSDIAMLYSQPYQPGVDPNIDYLRKLERAAEPGSVFNYNTAETNLVGTLVERAVGKSLTAYAGEKLVWPAGLEGELFWQVDTTGGNVGGCCISMRLGDYARIGQWILEGAPDGSGGSVVDPDFLANATAPAVNFGNGYGYGYFWWTYPGDAFGAIGIFGQGIYIDPADDLVIAYLGNWEGATSGQRSAIIGAVREALGD
ncbi:serine hydrolase domain-containing protein [Sphingomicrobium sediminis]|uniref:Beta-lactamase family protein n=1 Tax=Sphingomicrobium sediminis TaxID=2950949 RepID=A0A9X2EFA3_9SPHN|nr:serine hydrolase domain-containing protein [Sphingomicrobium sediminis]MCM8556356.1 beta-lactamase family protein [Sphingomicrobium sediminis]